MKKQILAIGCVAAILFMFSVSNVFSWGSATHAYIGKKIGAKGGLKDFDEMYGSLAPDVFNYTFAEWYEYIYKQTHYYAFMDMENAADKSLQKALSFGFVSHNGIWGADFTAHHSGITYGQSKGYVIKKAELLAGIMGPLLTGQGLPLEPEDLLEVCHNFIEPAVDILMKRVDPGIGKKVMTAALLRTHAFPDMLVEVYAEGLAGETGLNSNEAAQTIKTAEKDFRKITILYGMALSQPEETSVQLLAEQLASVAATYLRTLGYPIPEDANLTPLAVIGIQQGIELCKNDFKAEIAATIRFVKKNMAEHKKDK